MSFSVDVLTRRDESLLVMAGLVVLGLTATLLWASPSLVWTAEFSALVAIALATAGGGWIFGGTSIAALLFIFQQNPHRRDQEWFQWIAVYGIVILLRHSLVRLRRSESKTRALLASIDDLIMVIDEEGTFLEIASTKRQPRYRGNVSRVGNRLGDIYPPAHAEWVLGTIRTALSERRTIEVDYALPIDEQAVWFTASVSPLTTTTVLWAARDITARKRAEDVVQRAKVELEQRVEERTRELRDSEQRYRSVFDQAQDVIATVSTDGVITSLNPAFERVLGWPREVWIGQPLASLIPADSQEKTQRLFESLRSGDDSRLSHLVMIGNHGRRVALEVTVVNQVIGGVSVGFLGIARDITDRQEAEEKLRRSERQLAEAQRSAGLGSFEHDLIGGTMLWSDELFRILEVPPTTAPMPFSSFADLIAEEDLPKIEEVQRTLLARGEHEWEMRVRTRSGAEKTLWCSGTIVSDPSQGILRVMGAIKDVTERRRAEEMLRQSEERFRLLARATSNAVWDKDLVTGTVWRGDGYETLFGYSSGDMAPSSDAWLEKVHPDDRNRIEQLKQEAVESGQSSWSGEYRFRRADGSYATIIDRAYIVRDDQKRPTRMLGAMMDLTERKQLEEQLEQSKRVSSLGRVAASIAHEFNNVLMGIQPNVEVIQRSSPKGLRHVTDNILHAVQRGKRITDEILRFTRPAEPNLECVAVDEFFARWKHELQPLLGSNVNLKFDVGTDVHVLGDPLQLSQVFTNLALNARDAMDDRGGKLTISAHVSKSFGSFPFGVVKTPDRFVHFQVRDQGCGIAQERLTHIFEPLFTTKKGGIGLGLAIAYQVITRHNGHIFVESEPGIGSTFHLFIPATSPLIQEVAPVEVPQHMPLHRVLLVEDEPSVATGMAMLLEMEGITVAIASTGRESIPAVESFSPDIVVLDIGLPDMDGVGVYLEIARRWPQLPVLFSSGHGDSSKLETYLARPNVGFILKPYEFSAMRAELNRLADSRVAKAS